MCTQVRLQRSWILIQMVSNHKKKIQKLFSITFRTEPVCCPRIVFICELTTKKETSRYSGFCYPLFCQKEISTCEYALKEGSATYFLPLFESLGDNFHQLRRITILANFYFHKKVITAQGKHP